MSIVSTIYYPDPRRSLARESARCRRSPLPRRSLPVDVVDDRCDPSVFELTRLDPRRRAPAKADSRLAGFGLLPVRKPNIFPSPLVSMRLSNRSDGSLSGFRSLPLESLTLRSLPSIGSVRRPSTGAFQ